MDELRSMKPEEFSDILWEDLERQVEGFGKH